MGSMHVVFYWYNLEIGCSPMSNLHWLIIRIWSMVKKCVMIHLVDATFFEGWTAWFMPCHALFGRTWKIYVCFWLRISILIAVIIGSIDYRIQNVVESYLWYLCPDNNITPTKFTAIMSNCLWYHATGYILSWHLQNNGIIYTDIQSTVRVMEEVWKLDVQHNVSYKIQKRFLLFCLVLRWLYTTRWELCNLFAHVVGCVTAIGQFYDYNDDHQGTRELIPFIWPNLPVHNNRRHFDTLHNQFKFLWYVAPFGLLCYLLQ